MPQDSLTNEETESLARIIYVLRGGGKETIAGLLSLLVEAHRQNKQPGVSSKDIRRWALKQVFPNGPGWKVSMTNMLIPPARNATDTVLNNFVSAAINALRVELSKNSGQPEVALQWTVSEWWIGNELYYSLSAAPMSEKASLAPVSVFLCHSSGDKVHVRQLYRRLLKDGISCWFDEENLLPGQDWEAEIQRAVRSSNVVLVCRSRSSVSKEGFVQKEIRIALDAADEKPEGTIYVIPTRIENCSVPERLQRWQRVDLFQADGYGRLLKTLRSGSTAKSKGA